MNPELQPLIERYLAEGLDEQQSEALSRMLEQSPEARAEFRALTKVHAALAEHYSDDDLAKFDPVTIPNRVEKSVFAYWPIAAAVAGLLLLLSFLLRSPAQEPIAEIVKNDAEWAAPIDELLGKGRYEILSGLAELNISPGVSLAIEGPALFKLIDRNRVEVKRGRIAANVTDSGQGFTVVTPLGEIIDWGTRFGVRVGEDGSCEAHVFEGEIELIQDGNSQRLTDTEALRLGETTLFESDPESFPMPSHQLSTGLNGAVFEPSLHLGAGMPKVPGVWGGDASQIVPAFDGVQPYQGNGMLKFIAAHAAGSELVGQVASELWQIVDLRPYASRVHAGEVRAELSAYVNRLAETTNTEFGVSMVAFRGDFQQAPNYWDRKNEATSERLASTSSSLQADEESETWEQIRSDFAIPAGTDFLLVNLRATQNVSKRRESPFKGHFLDHANLTLTAEARASIPKAEWGGNNGDWRKPENWKVGVVPDPQRDRIEILGSGVAEVASKIQLKQSLIIAPNRESEGHLLIKEGGRLSKSGYGQLVVGYNEGGVASLTIRGTLETREQAFIGRNNSQSLVEIDGGVWDAGDGGIRMAQYGNRGPDTDARLLIRNGGRLKVERLSLIHDLATFHLENGEANVGRLEIGGDNGKAEVRLGDGILQVGELRFGAPNARFVFESKNAELRLAGSWTAEAIKSYSGANWRFQDAELTDFETEIARNNGFEFTRIRPKLQP